MKPKSDREQFLDDILAEAVPDDFRSRLLEHGLRQMRQKRRIRTARDSMVVILLLAAAAFLVWKRGAGPEMQAARKAGPWAAATAEVVKTVKTQLLDPARVVRTHAAAVPFIASSPDSVQVVKTRREEHFFHEINDQDLVRFLAGRSAALVRLGPGQAEVVFLQPPVEKEAVTPN